MNGARGIKDWLPANVTKKRKASDGGLSRVKKQICLSAHPMVGMEKSAPSLVPEGQRDVTVLVRV